MLIALGCYSKHEPSQPRFYPTSKSIFLFVKLLKALNLAKSPSFPYNFLLHRFHKPVLRKNTVFFTVPYSFHIFISLSLFYFFFLWESSVFHIFISLTLYFYFKRIISNLQNCRENDLLICSVNTLLSTYYASGPFLDSGNRAVHKTKSPMSWSRRSHVPNNVTWWSHRAHLSSFVYS